MKKLLLIFGIAITVASCECKRTHCDEKGGDSPVALAGTVERSLNGIKKVDALRMIDNFKKTMGDDKSPKIVNYLLKKDMVLKIIDILKKEKTFGFRVYFGKENETDNDVKLILVSSRYVGMDAVTGQKIYKDYYGHDDTHPLWSTDLDIDAIEKPTSPPYNSTGAELYVKSGQTGPGTCPIPNLSSHIDRDYAEQIVGNFGGREFNTRAAWFPISTFEELTSDAKCTGIRVYLATYTNTYYFDKYKNRDTFVLTAFEDKDGLKKDYFDCEQPLKRESLKKKEKLDGLPVPPLKNNGELCPDNCDQI